MALHQVHVDLRSILEFKHLVVVKVTLHDLAAFDVDLALQGGSQPIKDAPLQLLLGDMRIENLPAICNTSYFVNLYLATLTHRHLDHLRLKSFEVVREADPLKQTRWCFTPN